MPLPGKSKKQAVPLSPVSRLERLVKDKAFWKQFAEEQEQRREELAAKRKDAVLHLRINSRDLARLKEMAEAQGMKYQSFVADVLRRVAHNPSRPSSK